MNWKAFLITTVVVYAALGAIGGVIFFFVVTGIDPGWVLVFLPILFTAAVSLK